MSASIPFGKYHCNGNDFILIDNRSGGIRLNRAEIARICHRKFGVGGDGLILLNAIPGYDFEMKNYNSDGGECTMCGNGGRALIQFAFDLGIRPEIYRFFAIDGRHEAVLKEGRVELRMQAVREVLETPVGPSLDTGSPHLVVEVVNLLNHDVVEKGRALRSSPRFLPGGINVNFFEERDGKLFVRTYERGVEDETLSCGTGAIATALVVHQRKRLPFPSQGEVSVHCQGGDLQVRFTHLGPSHFDEIWLIGRAEPTFQGVLSASRGQS
ncbi:diaminopimelate epimerase [bacterium]|nr:diaminopimelate epimerase [bacterium]